MVNLALCDTAQGIKKNESQMGMTAKQLRPLTRLSRGLIKQLRDTKNACGFYEKHQKTVSREIVKKSIDFQG